MSVQSGHFCQGKGASSQRAKNRIEPFPGKIGRGIFNLVALALMVTELFNKVCERSRKEGRKVGRQEGRTTGRQDDRQDDRQDGRQDGRQAGRMTGRQAGRQTDRQTDRQTERTMLITQDGGCICPSDSSRRHLSLITQTCRLM